MEYKEYFKDPKWQKLRLKILERDEFCCQNCYDNEKPLHVHHRYYVRGKKPWEYEEKILITLCETCHKEQEKMQMYCDLLIFAIKERFLSDEVGLLVYLFNNFEMITTPDVFVNALCTLLMNKKMQYNMIQDYFIILSKYNKEKGK